MDINKLYNADNSGIMQKLKPLEDKIYEKSMLHLDIWRKNGIDKKDVVAYYDWMEREITDKFNTEFRLHIE